MAKKAAEKVVKEPKYQGWLFMGKTFLYLGIMLVLVYLYHFSHINGGSFIYNQF